MAAPDCPSAFDDFNVLRFRVVAYPLRARQRSARQAAQAEGQDRQRAPHAQDGYAGQCWPSESDDESPDLTGSSSSSVSAPAKALHQEHLDQRWWSGRCAWPCWMRCKGQIQMLQYVHYLFTARRRIVAVSGGLENPPLDNCGWRPNGESKATRTGLYDPPNYREKKSVRALVLFQALHLACTKTQDTFNNNCSVL